MLQHAQKYLEQGLPVFPVCPETYVPKVLWKPYQHRLPEPENLLYWWTEWPDAMIGMTTGELSGFVCIDVDPKNGGDPNRMLAEAPTDLRASTTHAGGLHLYFKHPGKFIGSRIGFYQGIDFKGDGGYIILPPSRKTTGSPYTWTAQGDASELPQHLIELFTTETETKGEADPFWVTGLLTKGAEVGRRNEQATRLAGYFASKGLSFDILASIMQTWNETANVAPLPVPELLTVVRHVFDREQRVVRKVSAQPAPQNVDFSIKKLGDYISEFCSNTNKWSVKDWLPESTIAFLVAAPESYKTWLLLDLAVSVASGTNFIGAYTVEEPGPVIIIQQEDFHTQMSQRISTILYNKLGVSDDYLIPAYTNLPIYLHPDRELRFNNELVMDKLEEKIAELRPKLIIIDPLYSAADTEGYMTNAVQDMFRLKSLRDKYGCSFVLAHHTRKTTSGSSERQDGWGSQFLNAFLETGWQIRRGEADHSIIVRRHFKTFVGFKEIRLDFNINTETLPYNYNVTEVTDATLTSMSVVQAITKKDMDQDELLAKLQCSEDVLLGFLGKLIQDKIIYKKRSGKYAVTRNAP